MVAEAFISLVLPAIENNCCIFALYSPILILSWHSESRNGSSSLSSASGANAVSRPA